MAAKYQLLVVDDDSLVLSAIKMALPSHWRMVGINRMQDINSEAMFHAALTDMHLTSNHAEADGLKVIDQLKKNDPQIEIIAMSGDLSLELMEACLKKGANRFIAKPLQVDEFLDNLSKIEALWHLREFSGRGPTRPWLGSSVKALEVHKKVASLCGESGPILIEGESGTGKEIIAHLLHNQDGERPLVAVNLAAISENLFESELFGHLKGAFTGAEQNKMGLIEAAHGGDLFLDEVEALPMSFQVKLLRFLESGEIKKVGSKDNTIVKTRLIAATNQNLHQLVKEGKFREDLLWRLDGKKIYLPPLRERAEDIPELANYFLSQERPKRNKTFNKEALESLKAYHWPGNVRELKRVCEQLSLTAPLPIIRSEDVNLLLNPHRVFESPGTEIDLKKGLTRLVEEFEAHAIKKCLNLESDIEKAANMLQISRSSLYKKIKDYGINL